MVMSILGPVLIMMLLFSLDFGRFNIGQILGQNRLATLNQSRRKKCRALHFDFFFDILENARERIDLLLDFELGGRFLKSLTEGLRRVHLGIPGRLQRHL